MDFRLGREFDFEACASFTAGLIALLDERPLSPGSLLNVNCPAVDDLGGAQVTRLGKRIYRDRLELQEEDETGSNPRRLYRIYGDDPSYHHEEGTDFAAIGAGMVSVTPLHFDLNDEQSMEQLRRWDLSGLIEAVAGAAAGTESAG
jgi:5'-nucleotidase